MKSSLRKKLLLTLLSTLLVWVVLVVGAKALSFAVGIRDPEMRFEHHIGMWEPAPLLGYKNQRGFDGTAWGRIPVRVGPQGFRGMRSVTKEHPGVQRIVAVGDSITWGAGVEEEHTYAAELERLFVESGESAEVINAGVVGYSALQEELLFERRILPLDPDVVLVQFCSNDILPSEDPFERCRAVCLRQLEAVAADTSHTWSEEDRSGFETLGRVFRQAKRVDPLMAAAPADLKLLAVRVFLEIPVQRMATLCAGRDVRLVYLLVPPREQDPTYQFLAAKVAAAVRAAGGEVLDLAPLLAQEVDAEKVEAAQEFPGWVKAVMRIPPFRDVNNVLLVQRFERLHEQTKYIDAMHPSRTGHRMMAEAIFAYLSRQ